MALGVQSVTFDNQSVQQTFPFGNVGDTLLIAITYRTSAQPVKFAYRDNWIKNTDTIYFPQSSPLEYNSEDLFKHPHVNKEAMWTTTAVDSAVIGNKVQLSPSTIRAAADQQFVEIEYNGEPVSGEFEYIIRAQKNIPLVQRENLQTNGNLSVPDYYAGTESLRHIFELNFFASNIAPSPYDTTKGVDTSAWFMQGNVGWFGEVFNGGSTLFSLDSITVDSDNGLLYKNDTVRVNAVISYLNGYTWDGTETVAFRLQRLINEEEFDDTLTYEQNLSIDRVTCSAANAISNGFTVFNATYSVDPSDATKINLSFDANLAASTADYEDYIIHFYINDTDEEPTTYKSQSVFGITGTAEQNVQIQGLSLVTPADHNFAEFNFYHHDNIDSTKTFNHSVCFVQDKEFCVFQHENINSEISVNAYKIGVYDKTTGAILESFDVATSNIPFSRDRGYIYPIGREEYNTISIIEAGNGHLFKYPFKIKDEWFGNDDVRVFLDVSFTGTYNGEAISDTIRYESPTVEIQTYDEDPYDHASTGATLTDFTDTTPATPLIEFFNDAGDPIDGFLSTGETTIQATFIEVGNNDYQATLASELSAYLQVYPSGISQEKRRVHHSEFDAESDSPFRAYSGIDNKAEIELDADGRTVYVRSKVDFQALKLLYGVNNYEVSVRLDKIQEGEPLEFEGIRSVFVKDGVIYASQGIVTATSGQGDKIYVGSATNERNPKSVVTDTLITDGVPSPNGIVWIPAISKWVICSTDTAAATVGFYNEDFSLDRVKVWSDDSATSYSSRIRYNFTDGTIVFGRTLKSEVVKILATDAYNGGSNPTTEIDLTLGTQISTTSGGVSGDTPQEMGIVNADNELWIPANGSTNAAIKVFDYTTGTWIADLGVTATNPTTHYGGAVYDPFLNRVLVCNRELNRIESYTTGTGRALDTTYTSTNLDTPGGVWYDEGNIYVADTNSIDGTPRLITIAK